MHMRNCVHESQARRMLATLGVYSAKRLLINIFCIYLKTVNYKTELQYWELEEVQLWGLHNFNVLFFLVYGSVMLAHKKKK